MPPSGPAASGRRVTLELSAEHKGQRLDRALAAALPDQSRSALQRLLREGRVSLAGKAARAAHRVRGGERVVIDLPGVMPSAIAAEEHSLSILYEDDDLIVLDKPAGMTVHPGAGARSGTLVNALLHHCRGLSAIGGAERPGIVHRLDRATSGVMVVAKNDAAHRSLAAQFKARSVSKVYEALVWGRPRPETGVIDAPIGRHRTARVRMAVRRDGRAARTAYRTVASFGPLSLLEIRPETGRTHQIRVHLQSIGHPILGDQTYGGGRGGTPRERRLKEALLAYAGLALHARRLVFTHPTSEQRREFAAPRPRDFADLIEALQAVADSPHPSRGGAP